MTRLSDAALHAATEPILVFDPLNDRILDANQACADLLKQAASTLPDSRVSALFPNQIPRLVVFTESVLAKGQDWTRDLQPFRADGTPVPVEIRAARLDNDARHAIVATLHDLEARERRDMDVEANAYLRRGLDTWQRTQTLFREMEERNQIILNTAGEGIYGVDADGTTTFVNPAAETLLGWPAAEIVGRKMHPVVHHSHPDHTPYPDADCPIYDAFRNGAVRTVGNEVFWRKDGSPIWVEYTSTPIMDHGSPVGAVIVFRDVTSRREADERLRLALQEVSQLRERLELENAYLQEEIRGDLHHALIGRSAAVQLVIEQVQLVAPTEAAVLITGESGTGKELVARAIHEASQRRDRPLIRVNCAAIPRELFESEFFGHVRGAFTGALRDRVGRFDLADGGTLFLDEVGEIPLELQGKLLRVLQEGQFERVGDERTRRVNVRLIAATNRDLKAEMRRHAFREDLYYRLNVFPIECAPLRERTEDIPPLAAHFLEAVGRRMRVSGLRLTSGDIDRLRGYAWPGNVRELENVIERAAILARGGRLRFDLPDYLRLPTHPPETPRSSPSSAIQTEAARRETYRAGLLAALEVSGGKVFGPGGAAELLGVKPTTLASRLRALGITTGRARGGTGMPA